MFNLRIAAACTAAAVTISPLACQVETETPGPAPLARDADLDFAEIVQDVEGESNVLIAYNDESLPVSRFTATATANGGALVLELVDDAGEPARLVQTLSAGGDRIVIDAVTTDGEYHWSGGIDDDVAAGLDGIPTVFVPHLALWAEGLNAQPELTQHNNNGELGFRSCADTCFWISLVVCAGVGAGSGGAGGIACEIYAHYVCQWQCAGT